MQKSRKSSEITDVNALGMYDFRMGEIENDPIYPYPTLRIYGHRGYAGYLVHIRFEETVYLACAPSFDYGFIWRMATEEEAARLHVLADEDRAQVYCLEENMSLYRTPLQREARQFFIVAWGLEITVEYDERFEFIVSNWGQPV